MRFNQFSKSFSARTSFEEDRSAEAIGGNSGSGRPQAGAALAEPLNELRDRAERQIFCCDGDLLKRYPVKHYLSFFQTLPEWASYRLVPQSAERFCDAIEAQAGRDVLEAYHRVAMLQSVADEAPGSGGRLTSAARELLQAYLRRVLRDMESPRDDFYVHGNDQFAKDFAVCRGKLLPCGVELVDRCSGVPRRTLGSGGIRQFVSGTQYLLLKARGFRPFYELHFDRRSMRSFNKNGYAELYLRIADLLVLNPEVRGVMSSSWWHDPQVAEVSPELAFIDEDPRKWGARVLFVGENQTATADATRFSKQRMMLHTHGLYHPRIYLLVWARQDILAWAQMCRTAR